MVVNAAVVPESVPPPDFFLAKRAPGSDADQTAAALRQSTDANAYTVTSTAELVRREQRSLTALTLDGLSRIEAVGAALIAAVGMGVLGAFLVIQRRREFAVLRMIGANTNQLLTGPALEGALAVLGSLAIGLPVGIGLGVLAVRVLGLCFTLPPPVVTIPAGSLAVLAVMVVAVSAIALALALRRVSDTEVASTLREP